MTNHGFLGRSSDEINDLERKMALEGIPFYVQDGFFIVRELNCE
jgi:hypothetical protein